MEIGLKAEEGPYHPDFSIIDNVPTNRKERMNAIWTIIVRGEKKAGGYNLQQLISKIAVRWATKRKTVAGYFEDLQRGGFTYIDNKLRVRPLMKKAKVIGK